MRISFFTCFLFFVITVLIGCTATGPADDGWETSEGFKEGDGLFSKSEGGYEFSFGEDKNKLGKKQDKQTREQQQTEQKNPVKYNTQVPTDYETYLRWRDARDNNSDEYQRFLKWQEFEDYLRWKESR